MLHKPLSLACAPLIRAALLSAALVHLPALPALANPQAIAPGEQALAEKERITAFQAGVAAYDAGDYTRAYEIWLPLAKLGDLAAQRNVGHLLRLGRGTARDLAASPLGADALGPTRRRASAIRGWPRTWGACAR